MAAEQVWNSIQKLTSLSRETLTFSGLSDMTKSLLISTEGGTPWSSGAYWTFLTISFTVLLLDQPQITNEAEMKWLILHLRCWEGELRLTVCVLLHPGSQRWMPWSQTPRYIAADKKSGDCIILWGDDHNWKQLNRSNTHEYLLNNVTCALSWCWALITC